MNKVHFLIALHNHQPVGNFDVVFQQTCRDAYKPFLDELRRHPAIRMALHFSGPLLEWMQHNRPDVVSEIRELVNAGQIEIIGGGFHEPILTMLPDRDKIGQIRTYADHLQQTFSTPVRGYWLTERVWEQALTSSLAEAGVAYTIVDDAHFKHAGLKEHELNGYFVTEDEGRTIAIFAGSERLRYVIPFDDPWRTTEYLRSMRTADDVLVVYADDGEKFGVWPKTHEHVYTNRWLPRWFEELERNLEWIEFVTFSEAIDRFAPRSKIYLPDSSYREMTEWAMPAGTLSEYDRTMRELEGNPLFERVRPFLRGGFWRNFKVKYPESNLMYSKMMRVSRKVDDICSEHPAAFDQARTELHRGQCNCAYWHGVFGGLYLPHLRHAIYEHLIEAESIVDRARGVRLEAEEYDYDTDGHPEVCVGNAAVAAVIKPGYGGHLIEFDVRNRNANLLAVLSRRYEAYHENITNPPQADESGEVQSIHHILAMKEEGLDKLLRYDWYRREGFVDHFLLADTQPESLMTMDFVERGDFVQGAYSSRLTKRKTVLHVELKRRGTVWLNDPGHPLTVRKTFTLHEGKPHIECSYEIVSDDDIDVTFAVECNLAFPGCDSDTWYYHLADGSPAGDLSALQSYQQQQSVGVIDGLRSFDVTLSYSAPADIWAIPIRTVSQSESGFESVFQSSAVVARWPLRLKAGRPWSVTITKAVAET